jgi:hypothetical protein
MPKYVDDVFNARQILKSSGIHFAGSRDARNGGDEKLRVTRWIGFASSAACVEELGLIMGDASTVV